MTTKIGDMLNALIDTRADIWTRWNDVKQRPGSNFKDPERRQLSLAMAHVDLAIKNLRNARDAWLEEEARRVAK